MRWILALPVCAACSIPAAAQPAPPDLQHGQYIVERLGLCGDCHTPRDPQGRPIASQLLQGGSIGFRPLHPMPFSPYAPPIAGGPPGWSNDQLVHFLQSGERPGKSPPLPPMPAYRMSEPDAAAVAAYLRSLK